MDDYKMFEKTENVTGYQRTESNSGILSIGEISGENGNYENGSLPLGDSCMVGRSPASQNNLSGNDLFAKDSTVLKTPSPASKTDGSRNRRSTDISSDDVAPINIGALDMDDEDGWLLRTKKTPKDPKKWIREELDLMPKNRPGSLAHILEQTTRGLGVRMTPLTARYSTPLHDAKFHSLVQEKHQSTSRNSFGSSLRTKCLADAVQDNVALCARGARGAPTFPGDTRDALLERQFSTDRNDNVVNSSVVARSTTTPNLLDGDLLTNADSIFKVGDNSWLTKTENTPSFLDSPQLNTPSFLDNPQLNTPSFLDSPHLTPKSKGRHEIDTRTFTRPKRTVKANSSNDANMIPVRLDFTDPASDTGLQETGSGTVDNLIRNESRPCADNFAEKDNGGSFLKLEDVTDVQVLARMQEESLRKRYRSPLRQKSQQDADESNGRLVKGQSFGSLSGQSDDLSSLSASNEDRASITKSSNSLSSGGCGSPVSRSDSLTNVNALMSFKKSRDFADGQQQSLPNLSRNTKISVPQSVPSDSKLYMSPAHKRSSIATPNGFSLKTRNISNAGQGIPEPSGISRPPSVISRPPSVISRPPSGISRPPSGIYKTPSGISRPPSGISRIQSGISRTPEISRPSQGLSRAPKEISSAEQETCTSTREAPIAAAPQTTTATAPINVKESKISNSSIATDKTVPEKSKKSPAPEKLSSGIPKPTSSRLRTPTNWKRTSLTVPPANDGSWREGCF